MHDMSPEAPRVLIADDDVSDLLVLRRLLRETPYIIDTVRSASQALRALTERTYAAVVADDDRLPDLSGTQLLYEAERAQPKALRILLARPERAPQLVGAAQQARYQLIARPFFAKPLVASLVEQAARWLAPEPPRDDTQKTVNPYLAGAPDADSRETATLARSQHRRLLLTLAEMVEAKSGHASGHGARVSALAGVLAREVGLSGDILEAVEDAALIHDAGELSLDPLLLQQQRALSDEERMEVRRHVESSYQIVRRAGLPPSVLAAVRHHHERWDGKGHPQGLAGAEIPVEARVVAIADTWDALATDRPYRAAVPLPRCAAVFASLAGNHLDPQLVALYLDRKLYDLIDWSDPPRPGTKLL
jgi:HD-GYP domain-containing protein (c-di-GMP phosphodiesterase class II)